MILYGITYSRGSLDLLPFTKLTSNNPQQRIQAAYQTHRTNRNTQQKAKLLAPDFPGVTVDEILANLEDPSKPDYQDPRHCLVFWARPTAPVRKLIYEIQQKLLEVAPCKCSFIEILFMITREKKRNNPTTPCPEKSSTTLYLPPQPPIPTKKSTHLTTQPALWTMPQASLHMTALEINHSLTTPEITTLLSQFPASTLAKMANTTKIHRARLVKPLLSYDSQALALSFLPAAGEPGLKGRPSADSVADTESSQDAFTYHHLRRELFAQATGAGVKVGSRYVVPSAHLTIARFIVREPDFDLQRFVEVIEGVNQWLVDEYWPKGEDGEECEVADRIKAGGEWVVGEEKGLEVRRGTLWYGSGGETVLLGDGF